MQFFINSCSAVQHWANSPLMNCVAVSELNSVKCWM